MNGPSVYAGRKASLASMHDKLPLVAPPMKELLCLDVFTAPVDTDRFGMFTGEVERTAGQFDTAVSKARLGMEATGAPIGFASEGSICVAGFVPVMSDLETVVIVDDTEGFVLAESSESHSIITHSWKLNNGLPTRDDLERAGFPEHGLIVRSDAAAGPVFKGIHSLEELTDAVTACRVATGAPVRVESDLRANHCPSRRPTIASAARRLAERLTVQCSSCGCPGWGRVDVLRGRPCRLCRHATQGVVADVLGCPRCAHRATGTACEVPADPSTCGYCNP